MDASGAGPTDDRLATGSTSSIGGSWPARHVLQYAGLVGLTIGLLAALGICGLMSIDYFAWHDVPVERARVTAQDVSSTQRVACGKSLWPDTQARITSFLVTQPRAGFPGSFSVAGCGLGVRVGDTVLMQRLSDTTEDDLHLGGQITPADFVTMGASFAGIGFMAAAAWTLLIAVLRPRWQKWVEAGRTPTA